MYKNKVVLITGSSRGIGYELSKHFLKNGATVIGLSRNSFSIGSDFYYHFTLDIGCPKSVESCFRNEISKKFKSIDILINNAAILKSQYSMIMPIMHAIEMINVNLLGTFIVSRESAKLMRSKDNSRIINIGSMASFLNPSGDSIYSATKTGIISLASVMSKEFSKFNITCNTLAITAIETDMLNSHSILAKQKIEKIINNLTIPRMANYSDIFNVVDFFSSEKSNYITGQTIYLGGIN